MRAWKPDLPIVHLAPKRTPLSTSALWSMSATGLDGCEKLLERIKKIVTDENGTGAAQVALLIENYPDFLSSRVENLLADVVKGCRVNDHFVMAEGESSTWNSSWPLLMEIRNARTGLLLQPESGDGDLVLRTSLPRFKRGDPPPGRGYWVQAGRSVKIQIPLVD